MATAGFRITVDDQKAFAELSGDLNPVHVDAAAARRVVAGVPIVHGMHLLLRALESCASAIPTDGRVALSAQFSRPVVVGESIQIVRESDSAIALVAEGLTVAQLSIETGSATARSSADPFAGARLPARRHRGPRVLTIEEAKGTSGELPWSRSAALGRRFPRATRALGADAIGALAALSRLVGMECPGRDSLLSQIRVQLSIRERSHAMKWRVVQTDRRFGLVHLDVDAGTVAGTVHAFVRPRPAEALQFADVAQRVSPDQFSGHRALVIGGSRGLGAATALIVAAGGGTSLATYTAGRREALQLRAEAARFGRNLDILRFDVIGDAPSRLARAFAHFQSTHVYYFATPRIFVRRREPFDAALFRRFADVYVDRFAALYAALQQVAPQVTVFYPSSTAVETPQRELTEYAAAKAAGESLCRTLNDVGVGRIVVARLPRVATDQTTTILPVPAIDPVSAMVPIVREMHRLTNR